MKKIYNLGIQSPKLVIAIMTLLTLLFASQLNKLRWETDARVYLPKGHDAIIYDEKVDEIFGVKDTIIVGIRNENGIFNLDTLARIDRIARALAALEGVQSTQAIDVASIATSAYFVGTENEIGSKPIMDKVPTSQAEIETIKKHLYDNADIFVGNIVSEDGKSAMIRAKLKEGINYRYMTYFQVQRIIAQETGDWSALSGFWDGSDSGNWGNNSEKETNAQGEEEPAWKKWQQKNADTAVEQKAPAVDTQAIPQGTDFQAMDFASEPVEKSQAATDSSSANPWWPGEAAQQETKAEPAPAPKKDQSAGANPWWPGNGGEKAATDSKPSADQFFLAGRPVIEVSSGLFAMEDMKNMIPLIIAVMAVVLFFVFRTGRGVALPITVMALSIIWTMGLMVILDVPLYTISTMLPVILAAVGIGDAVHLMSTYYDRVLEDPHRDPKLILQETMSRLGAPLITTTVTTGIGFLALLFAEMPPFRVFGVFAVLGIFISWMITIFLLPAILVMMKPKVAGYLQKKRALRVYKEQSLLARLLTSLGVWIDAHRGASIAVVAALMVVAAVGASRLYVDSSWLSDFREDSDLFIATQMLNKNFDGTIFLNVVIEAHEKDAFKEPALLEKVEALQNFVEQLPYVGDSLSLVDYLKNMNKNLHAGDAGFNVIPQSRALVAEYLFLFSVSGRPQELDQVVDYDYQKGLVTVSIQTDHTQHLKHIIDEVSAFNEKNFADQKVDVNLSGSGNNSWVWAKLLINSQTTAIVLSKIGILIIAALIFGSLVAGFFIVVPVTLSTLFVAGVAGFAGVSMDVSTALAAGIAIGVGVDYAVHYVFRYRAERRSGLDHAQASANTLRTTGRTIVFNATVVTAGFAVLYASQFPPHVKLGYFVSAYMLVSCVIAIFVLPALFSYFQPRFAATKKE